MNDLDVMRAARRKAETEYEASVAEAMLIVAENPYANIRRQQRDALVLRDTVRRLDATIAAEEHG